MTYQEQNGLDGTLSNIKRVEDDGSVAFIPLDPLNADYIAYLSWEAEGNSPLPADNPAETVPPFVSRRQFAKQMRIEGMITVDQSVAMIGAATPPPMVEALFGQLPETMQADAREDFGSDTYHRKNAALVALLAAAGKTSAEADQFFRNASLL